MAHHGMDTYISGIPVLIDNVGAMANHSHFSSYIAPDTVSWLLL